MRWEPRAKQQQRVALADFSAVPWQDFEKSERGPNNSSLFQPQACGRRRCTGLIACGAVRRRLVRAPSIVQTKRKTSTQRVLVFLGASSDTELFKNHRSTIRFQGHRIATCLYRTPMGGCIEKTVAFYIPHNLKIIKYAQRSLLPSPGANERCFFVYNERRHP